MLPNFDCRANRPAAHALDANRGQVIPQRLAQRVFVAASEIVWVPLEQVPKKLIDFFDQNLLRAFDLARFLIDRTIPFDRKAR
jgi:hypothetical protein